MPEANHLGKPASKPASKPVRNYRILMIAPTSFFLDYGCHVRIVEEARILQQLGQRVTIVTYANGRDLPDLEIHRTLPIPWRQHYEVGSSRHKIGFDALLGIKTLALLARNRFDVIHAHLHEGALIGQVLGGLFGIPVLFDFQGSLTEEMIDHKFLQRESKLYPPLRRLERHIDCSSPIIFTSSNNSQRVLTEDFGCSAAQIRPLPDCVNTRNFRPAGAFDPAELAVIRQRWNVPGDARLIVYLGLLAEYQGTTHLLQVMQRMRELRPDVYLLLMGFPGVDTYQMKAAELGVSDRVIFTGRVPYEYAPQHIALGEVAVAPKLSLTESAGKLLNYMAAALPTVAYDTPVAREYLGASGKFAARGSVDSLLENLLFLLDHPIEAHAMGERLRQRAIELFEWQRAGLQILDAYRALVERGPSSEETSSKMAVPQD
jgi:glycosyltransferase involved in cell wall biosynthesis